jgi:hypothetical protein
MDALTGILGRLRSQYSIRTRSMPHSRLRSGLSEAFAFQPASATSSSHQNLWPRLSLAFLVQ